jgi:predicted Zn-dependent protease with MMP-like domain
MKEEEFEKLVKEAIGDLPEKIRQKMENVAIVIDKRPTQEQLREIGMRYGDFLLGLYEGTPKTTWGRGFGGNLPDKITIFQESIEKFSSMAEGAKELVKNTVWHEIAHHFGFDEKKVRLLEQKWKNKSKI